MTETSTGQSSEEGRILEVVTRFCELLEAKFRPVGITWMGNLGHPLNLPSDQCVFVVRGPRRGYVVLPLGLRGRLEPEEWKPLIASAIIYQLRPEVKRVWTIAFRLLVVSLVAAFAAPFALLIIERGFASLQIGGLLLLASLMWMLLPRAYNFHLLRRLHLKADRRAGDVLGKERFTRTLEKVAAMRILDLEERLSQKQTMWSRQVSPWPTITERLENLKRQSHVANSV